MRKKLQAIFLSIPLLFFIIWVGYFEYQKTNRQFVTLPVKGLFTNDFLSNHYVYYEIDWEKAKCEHNNCDYLNKDAFCQKKIYSSCENFFYIPEKYDEKLENLFFSKNKKDMTFEIVYSYTGKTAYATQFLINGKDYKEFLENN